MGDCNYFYPFGYNLHFVSGEREAYQAISEKISGRKGLLARVLSNAMLMVIILHAVAIWLVRSCHRYIP